MANEEMIQVLRNHGAYAYGQKSDINQIADEWEENDFSPAQVDAWLEAGCFRADDARMLADHDITPAQASRDVDKGTGAYRESIGYKFANSDLDIEDVLKLVEEVA